MSAFQLREYYWWIQATQGCSAALKPRKKLPVLIVTGVWETRQLAVHDTSGKVFVRNKQCLWIELYHSGICWFSLVNSPDYFGNLMSTEIQLLLSRLKHYCSAQNDTNSLLIQSIRISRSETQTNIYNIYINKSQMKFLLSFLPWCNITDHLLLWETLVTKMIRCGLFPRGLNLIHKINMKCTWHYNRTDVIVEDRISWETRR